MALFAFAIKKPTPPEPPTTSGTLWTLGRGYWGQLGNNTNGSSSVESSPIQVGSDTDWTSIEGGRSAARSLKTDGTSWAWGGDFSNQGWNPGGHRSSPTQIGSDTDWERSQAGWQHGLGVKTNGELWAWGLNGNGECGLGNIITPQTVPVQVGLLTDWADISLGAGHSAGLKTDGTLWMWGINTSGQCGLGDNTNKSSPTQIGSDTDWESVSCGNQFTCAIKTDGTLWAWGYNIYGALGLGDTTVRSSPDQVGSDTDWALVTGGRNATFAIKTNGSLWAWGDNTYGLLGLGNTTNYSTPQQVGTLTDWATVSNNSDNFSDFAVALKTDGTIWAWGRNNYGQLGQEDIVDRSSPDQIGSLTTWLSISAGEDAIVAIQSA